MEREAPYTLRAGYLKGAEQVSFNVPLNVRTSSNSASKQLLNIGYSTSSRQFCDLLTEAQLRSINHKTVESEYYNRFVPLK